MDAPDPAIWIEFAARPYSLFVVSLWHYSYEKYIPLISGGTIAISDGIFIQGKNGIVKNYRKITQLDALRDFFRKHVLGDRAMLMDLIAEAESLNEEAEMRLVAASKSKGRGRTEEEAISLGYFIDLVCRVTVFGAVMPRFILEALNACTLDAADECAELRSECEKLRAVSFYPKLLAEIIMPMVEEKAGKEFAPFITIYELEKGDFFAAKERLVLHRQGFTFVYTSQQDGRYSIEWQTPEEMRQPPTRITGRTACRGIARGIARICLTLGGEDVKVFNDGDILVTVNCNPNLMHLIRKAGAIVSDEGGITCHAAIVSRELNKPCIVGTRSATSMIRNGSHIEVRADEGWVAEYV